jgi:hypothetical protein
MSVASLVVAEVADLKSYRQLFVIFFFLFVLSSFPYSLEPSLIIHKQLQNSIRRTANISLYLKNYLQF